jgi:hypothetical protein
MLQFHLLVLYSGDHAQFYCRSTSAWFRSKAPVEIQNVQFLVRQSYRLYSDSTQTLLRLYSDSTQTLLRLYSDSTQTLLRLYSDSTQTLLGFLVIAGCLVDVHTT